MCDQAPVWTSNQYTGGRLSSEPARIEKVSSADVSGPFPFMALSYFLRYVLRFYIHMNLICFNSVITSCSISPWYDQTPACTRNQIAMVAVWAVDQSEWKCSVDQMLVDVFSLWRCFVSKYMLHFHIQTNLIWFSSVIINAWYFKMRQFIFQRLKGRLVIYWEVLIG